MSRQHIGKNRAHDMHGVRRQESAHEEKYVIEEVAEAQRPENRGKKNKPGKNRQHKVIRQRSRDLERMVAHHVAVSRAESLLDTADAHSLTIVLDGRRGNTEMTVSQVANGSALWWRSAGSGQTSESPSLAPPRNSQRELRNARISFLCL